MTSNGVRDSTFRASKSTQNYSIDSNGTIADDIWYYNGLKPKNTAKLPLTMTTGRHFEITGLQGQQVKIIEKMFFDWDFRKWG